MEFVTIIMATYNRAHFIVETLNSIQNQTYKFWECLLIDDGSTDNTLEVLEPVLRTDKRFKYFKRPENYLKGLPGCRNYGLDIAKGAYIIFFDDDDIVHPNNLKYCIEVIQKEKIDFCHYKKQPFFNELPMPLNNPLLINGIISEIKLNLVIQQQIALASCTFMWSKNCFEKIRFVEKLQYAEEWECYSRIISKGFSGVEINNVLYFNRKHSNSNTGEFYNNNPKRIESKKEAIRLIMKNLATKNLLTSDIVNYLVGDSILFRDYILLKDILKIGKVTFKNRLYLKVKFLLFPVWKIYKRFKKKNQ